MTLKRKRRILKTIILVVYLIIITLPYLESRKVNKIHRNFSKLEYAVYVNVLFNDNKKKDTLVLYCDSVNLFIKNNPIENKSFIDCDSIDPTGFVNSVLEIDETYRERAGNSNNLMYFTIFIAQILLYFARKIVDKKLKDEEQDSVQ